jgi:hypothetical protein
MTLDLDRLAAVLDMVLPGDGVFPPASAVGLAAAVAAHDRFTLAAADLLAALEAQPATVAAALEALDAAGDPRFAAFLVGAYSLYYTRPAVIDAVERETGYAARPPQPEGYVLPPFDPALVAVPAARPPSWRNPDEVTT